MKVRRPFLLALLLSLLIHALLAGLGVTISVLVPPKDRLAEEKSKPIEVVVFPKGLQIADISPPAEEKIPDKARFIGEYDSTVKEETVSPSRRPEGGTPGTTKKNAPTLEKTLQDKLAPKKETSFAAKSPEKVLRGGENDYFNGPSEDFFPDYNLGGHTYLNVLKFPKVGYFVRLKKAFRTTFDPVPALRSSLNQVSKGQIDVVLAVTVDRMGKLADLQILRSSGLPSYDREAVRTVRDSAPFSVPPRELLDDSSMLRMAWTFTVYL